MKGRKPLQRGSLADRWVMNKWALAGGFCWPVVLLLVMAFLFSPNEVLAFKLFHTETGNVVKWPNKEAHYLVNPAGAPDFFLSAVSKSMDTWNRVASSDFVFRMQGTTTDTSFGIFDGVNIVTFGKTAENSELGVNYLWYDTETGEIFDSDIRISSAVTWSNDGAPQAYDLQSVITHEFGHTLYLGDLYGQQDVEKTMFGIAIPGDMGKRTLHSDDIDGISFLFPQQVEIAGSGDGGGGGGGCFIATAAYGSYAHPYVMVLRKFRDQHLLTNRPGRYLVKWYYRTSPPIADIIARHEGLKVVTRAGLALVVFGLLHPGVSVSVMVMALFLLFLTAGSVRRKRGVK